MRQVSLLGVFLFLVSLALALVLEVAPLPEAMQGWRPLWLALVMSFWALENSRGGSLLLAWLVGLLQDVLYGSLLGLHAFFLVIVVFAILRVQRRLRMFPVWQQAFFLTLVFAFGQLLMFWLEVLAGTPRLLLQYMLPALVSGLLWPWVWLLLHVLQRGVLRR